MTRRVPHQPSAIMLQVETLPSGGYRFSSPQARGWAAVAANPGDVLRSLHTAFQEVQIASYARARAEVYDLDALTAHVPGDPLAAAPQQRIRRPRNPNTRRTHSPADWSKMTDQSGTRWRSPSGRMYREDTATVRNMVAKRTALGLPI